MGELMTLYGRTDGANTAGTVLLRSQVIVGSVNPDGTPVDGGAYRVQIPWGMKLKIWAIRAYGDVATKFTIKYCVYDPATGTEACRDVGEVSVQAQQFVEKRRPIIIENMAPFDYLRVDWTQSTAGNAVIELDVEVTE